MNQMTQATLALTLARADLEAAQINEPRTTTGPKKQASVPRGGQGLQGTNLPHRRPVPVLGKHSVAATHFLVSVGWEAH